MSSQPPPEPPVSDPLQFDHVEAADDKMDEVATCAACGQDLTDAYYEINGNVACASCRERLRLIHEGGSAGRRMMRASLAGLVAAAAGTALYYGIAAVTGYEIGLVAIVVGLMVGAAVRWGADRRGGWQYQLLAMTLTYVSIVATYVPYVIDGFEASAQEAAPGASEELPETTPPQGDGADDDAMEPATVLGAEAAEGDGEQAGGADLLLGILLIMAIALAAPFLGGFDNLMGLIIIGIGVYEAWKLNKRAELSISGPHRLGEPAPERIVLGE